MDQLKKYQRPLLLVAAAIIIGGLLYIIQQPAGKEPERSLDTAVDEQAARTEQPEAAVESDAPEERTKTAKPAAESPAGFVPHKALYEINLVATHGGAQIVNISGQMFFKWELSCEAWITDHRFKLLYEYADTPAMRITSDFSTFEPFDGKSFDFSSRRKRDGEIYEEYRGRAEIREDGEGQVVYTKPEGLVYDLPAGTMFPMAHTKAVKRAIEEGERFFTATVFDGSDDEGPVMINAFIGDEANAMAHVDGSGDLDLSLINTPARHVRLAFFPVFEDNESSDYEMSLVFHDNGVISHMLIEYDDFTISQDLVALEPLDATGCSEEN